MIIEMRTYKTKPGLRSRFLEIFRAKSIPAHTEIGMKILGPFLAVEDPDTFFMRGFPDSREPMKAKVYEGGVKGGQASGTTGRNRPSRGRGPLDDLKKVPGIDPAKLESVKQQLEFQ
jgi:hypothetical protein